MLYEYLLVLTFAHNDNNNLSQLLFLFMKVPIYSILVGGDSPVSRAEVSELSLFGLSLLE